jgi:hypothetical protein
MLPLTNVYTPKLPVTSCDLLYDRVLPSTTPTERPADAGIEQPVGSAGESHDNALAEPMIRVFKKGEVCRRAL